MVYGTVLLTADSAIGQKVLASCGAAAWTIGQEYDLTAPGCPAAGLRPRSTCIGDYELVRVQNGVYYPGYRAADMCLRSGRPTRTQSVGARKVSG